MKEILQELVSTSVVDDKLVSLLVRHCDTINTKRIEAQKRAETNYNDFWKQARELFYPLQVTVFT